MNYLSEEEYKKVFKLAPVCCVDLLVVNKGKFLLVKRTMEPVKGEWWFPGGRIRKGEYLNDAIRRIAMTELGISISIRKNIGVYEEFFDRGPFDLRNIHNIIICFLVVPVREDPKIVLDETSSEYKWYDTVMPECHPYIRTVLKTINWW